MMIDKLWQTIAIIYEIAKQASNLLLRKRRPIKIDHSEKMGTNQNTLTQCQTNADKSKHFNPMSDKCWPIKTL